MLYIQSQTNVHDLATDGDTQLLLLVMDIEESLPEIHPLKKYSNQEVVPFVWSDVIRSAVYAEDSHSHSLHLV